MTASSKRHFLQTKAVYVAAALAALAVGMSLTGRVELMAKAFMRADAVAFHVPGTEPSFPPSSPGSRTGTASIERSLLHPDVVFPAYFGDVQGASAGWMDESRRSFRALLDLYTVRQSVDDNFTLRVIDKTTGKTLEVVRLDELADLYNLTAVTEWTETDAVRREKTTEIVNRYVDAGYDRRNVMVKWGRRNQVHEAMERDLAFAEYERALAKQHGFSLLATQIGTVETFNNDRLISRVGARSRYQILPDLLKEFGVGRYRLETAGGEPIEVIEEWHPFFTMDVSMTLLAAYRNGVGHEIPGISAYHTGPFNIFRVYKKFLTSNAGRLPEEPSVVDAFVWALTLGYDEVSRSTSFRHYSRGYIPSAYGALVEAANTTTDTTATLIAEAVRLKRGSSIFLSSLLKELERSGPNLDWRVTEDNSYERFRAVNMHFDIPPATASYVPPHGDVRLTSHANGQEVLFFLPLGSSAILESAWPDRFDASTSVRYDRKTYQADPTQITMWDKMYDRLNSQTEHFGFSRDARAQLYFLADKFGELERENPTPFRQRQLSIIRTHVTFWRSMHFDDLLRVTEATLKSRPAQVMPPSTIERTEIPAVAS